MMEAVQTSEMLLNSYQATRRYNPEDSQLRTQRRENLKSNSFLVFPALLGMKEVSFRTLHFFSVSLLQGLMV
jgi:hypothetical protein